MRRTNRDSNVDVPGPNCCVGTFETDAIAEMTRIGVCSGSGNGNWVQVDADSSCRCVIAKEPKQQLGPSTAQVHDFCVREGLKGGDEFACVKVGKRGVEIEVGMSRNRFRFHLGTVFQALDEGMSSCGRS